MVQARIPVVRASPGMTEFMTYLALGFSALLPLINPLGTALEFLGVVVVSEARLYKFLARKMAINTTLFLAIVASVRPNILQFSVSPSRSCNWWAARFWRRWGGSFSISQTKYGTPKARKSFESWKTP